MFGALERALVADCAIKVTVGHVLVKFERLAVVLAKEGQTCFDEAFRLAPCDGPVELLLSILDHLLGPLSLGNSFVSQVFEELLPHRVLSGLEFV